MLLKMRMVKMDCAICCLRKSEDFCKTQ